MSSAFPVLIIRPWRIFLPIFLSFSSVIHLFFFLIHLFFSENFTSYIHNTQTYIVLVCSSWCTLNFDLSNYMTHATMLHSLNMVKLYLKKIIPCVFKLTFVFFSSESENVPILSSIILYAQNHLLTMLVKSTKAYWSLQCSMHYRWSTCVLFPSWYNPPWRLQSFTVYLCSNKLALAITSALNGTQPVSYHNSSSASLCTVQSRMYNRFTPCI